MEDDEHVRVVQKITGTLLVIAWLVGTLALTIDAVDASIPPYWLPFTAIVFLLIGKLWDLEVEKYIPGGTGGPDGSQGED